MNLNRQSKSVKSNLILVTLSACLLATGCGGTKKKVNPVGSATPVLSQQLASPSLSYMSADLEKAGDKDISAEQWLKIAQDNYDAKKYARALRAATEALNMDDESIEARELAMLSAVRVTQSNIDAYSDNALMSDYDRTELRNTFADVTSLINTP